jgi:hypothetical protein
MEDAMTRAARAAVLGVEVPYVKLGDIEVSVEWTVKNLEPVEGTFFIELNGANEFFEYDPDLIVIGDVFAPSHHMVLEYAIRIRDIRGIVNERLLEAPANELTVFAPMVYAVGVMPP